MGYTKIPPCSIICDPYSTVTMHQTRPGTFIFFWSHSTMAARSCRSIIAVVQLKRRFGNVEESYRSNWQHAIWSLLRHLRLTVLCSSNCRSRTAFGYFIRFSLHPKIQKRSPFLPCNSPSPPPAKKKQSPWSFLEKSFHCAFSFLSKRGWDGLRRSDNVPLDVGSASCSSSCLTSTRKVALAALTSTVAWLCCFGFFAWRLLDIQSRWNLSETHGKF